MKISDLFAPVIAIKNFCMARPKTVIVVGSLAIMAYLTADKVSNFTNCIMHASVTATDFDCLFSFPDGQTAIGRCPSPCGSSEVEASIGKVKDAISELLNQFIKQ